MIIRLILTLSFLVSFRIAQGQVIHDYAGRVVDAETGEPLPYASIYVGEGRGTLTNIEGDFKYQAEESDIVTFSFIGYGKLRVRATEIPSIVRLKPYMTPLQEITVLPIDEKGVLKRVIDNLKKDYKKKSEWTRKYFFRALIEEETATYIAEAFMNACSIVNIRSAEITSGLQGYDQGTGKDRLLLKSSNIHNLIEVGPMTANSYLWSGVVKPLQSYSSMRKYYKPRFEYLTGEDGESLYRIEFPLKDECITRLSLKPYITGTAYVDVETSRLLRFDGSCHNSKVRMGLISYPTAVDFHMEYDYSKESASVSNMAIQGGNAFSIYRALLFAIEEDKQESVRKKASGSNIVTALSQAGYDESLWSKYDIIKRTKEEEKAAFGRNAE
ncbi:MAG: carboxypeptidase-like regulatory domain-containing protein [Bacteroidaceae bacterium]|nr:carboxypeptidase-like regulatory domain-containing protein [Bacteroidaceae bacterium]